MMAVFSNDPFILSSQQIRMEREDLEYVISFLHD